jgi:hypothetical protein
MSYYCNQIYFVLTFFAALMGPFSPPFFSVVECRLIMLSETRINVKNPASIYRTKKIKIKSKSVKVNAYLYITDITHRNNI